MGIWQMLAGLRAVPCRRSKGSFARLGCKEWISGNGECVVYEPEEGSVEPAIQLPDSMHCRNCWT